MKLSISSSVIDQRVEWPDLNFSSGSAAQRLRVSNLDAPTAWPSERFAEKLSAQKLPVS